MRRQSPLEKGRCIYRAQFRTEPEPIGARDLAMPDGHPSPQGTEWSAGDWCDYLRLLALVPGSLRRQIGRRGRCGARIYDAIGTAILGLARGRASVLRLWKRTSRPDPVIVPGPDGSRMVKHGLPVPGYAATTYGHYIHFSQGQIPRLLINHEYVHVLQTRRDGMSFLIRYAIQQFKARRRGRHPYWDNAYEAEALAIERHLTQHPWLPNLWDLPPR